MPVDKPGSKPLAVTVYGLLVCAGVAIAYFELHGVFPTAVGVVLPVGYVFIVVLMVRRRVFLPNEQGNRPRFSIGIKIPDLAKSLICLVAAILWVGLAGSMTRDTPAGNAVAVVPSLAILAIGAFFFFRGFLKRIR